MSAEEVARFREDGHKLTVEHLPELHSVVVTIVGPHSTANIVAPQAGVVEFLRAVADELEHRFARDGEKEGE